MKLRVALVFLSLFTAFISTPYAEVDQKTPPLRFFGLHIHRADQGTAWPTVAFGSWRLWDAGVTWANLEPSPGNWNFSRLDRYLAMAKLTNVEVILPLSNTPRWAASRPNERSGYQMGNASEPIKIEDWRRYIATIGERYKGQIKYYEIWNEPNIKHHYSGTPEKLVELTCEAFNILKAIDPSNKIVSPGMSAGEKNHIAYLDQFLALGGNKCIDVIGHHFYVPNSPPENMIPMIRKVRGVMAKNGISNKPLWNTETGWWIPNGDGTPEQPMISKGGWRRVSPTDEAGEFVLRAFLLAKAEGVDRFFWYSWDHTGGLGLIEPRTGTPKAIEAKWREAVDLLTDASTVRCTNQAKNWQCTITYLKRTAINVSWTVEEALSN